MGSGHVSCGDGRLVAKLRRGLPWWQLDLRAERIKRLVDGPAGATGCDLENQAVRVGKVDALKVDAVCTDR